MNQLSHEGLLFYVALACGNCLLLWGVDSWLDHRVRREASIEGLGLYNYRMWQRIRWKNRFTLFHLRRWCRGCWEERR
jgi:hypothetical protein